jgi:aminoglycoside/choline kinase family phosphotransferase
MSATRALSDAEIVACAEPWLAAAGWPLASIEPLAGDVSPRRYFRVRSALAARGDASAILSYYPEPARDAGRRFLATTTLLATAGVRVPRIEVAALGDGEPGFVLLEDAGVRTLYDLEGLDWPEVAPWLDRAVEIVATVQRVAPAAVVALNPPLDAALLRRELEQTWELLFLPHGASADPSFARDVRATFDLLCDRLGAQPAVVCHRDYMARNLVPLAGGDLVVLDHQDLRLGPAAYDLASLLNDSLYPPAAAEAVWRDRGLAASALVREDYDRAVAQRGLKIAGTFLAFAARGSRRHLRLLGPSVERALDALARLPEGAEITPALGRWWERASATLIS